MIRVQIIRELRGHGVFDWRVAVLGIGGRSRHPLLSACREIKRMGGDERDTCGLFREGRDKPDATCSVGWGAEHTVSEPDKGRIKFAKRRQFHGAKEKRGAETV